MTTTRDAPTYGDALASMATTERLARRALHLLDGSLFTPPDDRDDLGVWLAAHIDNVHRLSSGEQVIFAVALCVWNGAVLPDHDGEPLASFHALHRLDDDNRRAVGAIIGEWLS